MRFGFGTDDVIAVMDDPPSRKTIRETLQTMEQLGYRREEQHWKQGNGERFCSRARRTAT